MEQLLRERDSEVSHPWRGTLVLALLLSYFGLFGMMIGGLGVLWAEVVRALQLSEGIFGSAQLVAPLISVVLLLLGGPLTAWAGKKRLAIVSLALLAASLLAVARAEGLWGLVGALAISGVGSGLLELAMNGATLDWERVSGRAMMSVMHAGFSGGAVLGALLGGGLLELGWSYGQVLVLLALLFGLAVVATLPVRYPPEDAGHADEHGPGTMLRLLIGQRALIALALLCLLGIVGESVAMLWSVIYLRELGAQVIVGGAAFALFNGAMFVGRLANAPLVARKGSRVSLLVSGVGLLLAGALLMAPGGVPGAIAGFALLGLAVAGVVPTTLSAAARLAPGNSGAVAGALMAAAYAGFVICPPLIGWVAELTSLRVALLTVGLSGLGILWLIREVR